MILLVAVLNILVIAVGAFYLFKHTKEPVGNYFLSGLGSKLLAGILLGLAYTMYYPGGDTFTFFTDAVRLSDLARRDFSAYIGFLMNGHGEVELYNSEPRSLFFIAILSAVTLVTNNNYWISSLWFSFFSFAGTWYLLRKVALVLPGEKLAAAWAIVFLPSVLFWSSGVLKESLAFGALAFLAGQFIHLMEGRKLQWPDYLLSIACAALLINLKYYWAGVFFPCAASGIVVRKLLERPGRRAWILMSGWFLVFAALCFSVSFLHPNFRFGRMPAVIAENHDLIVGISSPEDLIHYHEVEGSWSAILLNAPWALASGLFRPLFFEAHSVFPFLASLENTFLVALAMLAIFRRPAIAGSHRLYLVASVTFVVILCMMLALSTPNLGTLSRYRIGFLPFLVLLLLVHTRVTKFFTRFN